MRLAAVYLPKNCLPYLFGEGHAELTLNLGGRYNYEIKENSDNIQLKILSDNENFIPDFWGKNISLISAIVGRNGIGKTSILRALHSFGDKKKKNAFYLFEESEESFYYYNELETKTVISDLEIKEINSNSLESVKHYYTPIVDVEQINTLSQLNLVSTGEENLSQLYLKQLKQDVILLNDPVKGTLKSVYPDFPEYKELEIKVTNHRKFDFKNVYATANLGNQNRDSVAKIYIESDLEDLESGKWGDSISPGLVRDQFLEKYINIINSSGLNSLFDRLWSLDEYQHDNNNDHVHDEGDFIANFEVTLFSYLILNATFPQTPFQGTYDFQNILDQEAFQDRFDSFFDLYMVSIYNIVRDNINEKLGRVSILDYNQIKEIISVEINKKFKSSGFKSSDAVELMLRYLDRFKAFYDLYCTLNDLISGNKLELKEDTLVYRIEEHNADDFYNLIESYNHILGLTGNFIYRLDLLSIKSKYPLSSGEKALLNFFARINNRIDRMNSSSYAHPIFNYYLLLLDEPELGYHPVWKRKFIDAITKAIPVLFYKLTPTRNLFDSDSQKFDELKTQIIFTTHDPLTLSDIPISNVTFIDRNEGTNDSFIVDHKSDSNLATFGANVHDLLAHSFFLENGFMGEFAQYVITDLINYLTFEEDKEVLNSNQNPDIKWNNEKAEKVIRMIDEPLIKERLQSLFDKKVLSKDKELLRLKISQLNQQLKKLEDEEN
ncbi:AAA family ATPase [Aquimarina litoralis]|uniref:AAA family ATPase n=1 Tax=Aquimarina litoralis TaxID=584605 RepID=A0ABP3U100_9FLAO